MSSRRGAAIALRRPERPIVTVTCRRYRATIAIMEDQDAILYRLAFDLASALAEAAAARRPGRLLTDSVAEESAAAILAEVLEQLGTAGQRVDGGIVKEAVEDALAGRQPQW